MNTITMYFAVLISTAFLKNNIHEFPAFDPAAGILHFLAWVVIALSMAGMVGASFDEWKTKKKKADK